MSCPAWPTTRGAVHSPTLTCLNGRIQRSLLVRRARIRGCDPTALGDKIRRTVIPADHALRSTDARMESATPEMRRKVFWSRAAEPYQWPPGINRVNKMVPPPDPRGSPRTCPPDISAAAGVPVSTSKSKVQSQCRPAFAEILTNPLSSAESCHNLSGDVGASRPGESCLPPCDRLASAVTGIVSLDLCGWNPLPALSDTDRDTADSKTELEQTTSKGKPQSQNDRAKTAVHMRAIERRLQRLESHLALAPSIRKRLTTVISALARPLNMANSTCRRTLYPGGTHRGAEFAVWTKYARWRPSHARSSRGSGRDPAVRRDRGSHR